MKLEPIVGRYAHIGEQRVYFEEAGRGIPLVCLHTAGSDGRQYRAVLNDSSITKSYRVIAFDMPWHGKSSPPAGWEKEDYRLTTGAYILNIKSTNPTNVFLREVEPNVTDVVITQFYESSWLDRAANWFKRVFHR